MSDDDRWITVDGRRWRKSEPSIPARLRKELVDELMSYRRAVARALRSGSQQGLQLARGRVHAAKLALGERGTPWWNEATPDDLRSRVEAAIDVLTLHRSPDGSICPSDVARVVGGSNWRRLLDLVRSVGADMAERRLIDIIQHGQVVNDGPWRGPVRFRRALTANDRI